MLPRGCHILGPWAASADNDGDDNICDDHNDGDMICNNDIDTYVIQMMITMMPICNVI